MIAALAFLVVPAALYMGNPEFTCGEIDVPQEDPQYDESIGQGKDADENSKSANLANNLDTSKPVDKIADKMDEKGDDKKPIESSGKRFQPDNQRAMDEAKQRRERLLQAANAVLNRHDQPRSAEKPTAKQIENRRASTGSKNADRPVEFTPPARLAPAPAPASFVRTEKSETSDTPDTAVPKTPDQPTLSAPIIPRTNSAYKLRVERQQQQQLINQQQATTPLTRTVSPMRPPKSEPQQSESVSPRAREDRLTTLQLTQTNPTTPTPTTGSPASTLSSMPSFSNVSSTKESLNSNPASNSQAGPGPAARVERTSPVRVPSSKNMTPTQVQQAQQSPQSQQQQALPPLPPSRRREDISPARLKNLPSPSSVAAATAAANPAAASTPAAAVTSPVPAHSVATTSAYLTPREKQQRALAELRRQEEEQRTLAKEAIQKELQDALDVLHQQEALQREKDDSHRSHALEEQRRREMVQQAILEEKQRIERDGEIQREERRKLKEQQQAVEAEQRQMDQRTMAELLLEVERDRQLEVQLTPEERAQQDAILEQLRVKNQYPYPRGHSQSSLPNIDTIGSSSASRSRPNSQSTSPMVSPMISPDVSPNSSMRIPHDANSTASTSAPATVNSDGSSLSPYHNRLSRPSSGQSLTTTTLPPPVSLSGSSNKLPSPAHPVVTLPSPTTAGADVGVGTIGDRRTLSSQRLVRDGRSPTSASTPTSAPSTSGIGALTVSPVKLSAESVNRIIMEQAHTFEDPTLQQQRPKNATTEKGNRRDSNGSTTSSSAAANGNSNSRRTSTASNNSSFPPKTNGSSAPVTPATAVRRTGSTSALKSASSPKQQPEQQQFDEDSLEDADLLLQPEDEEQRILSAREELAMRIDAYIRTQKKFSSAVPRKHKVSVSKINTECDKYRRLYNDKVGDDSLKITPSTMLHFLQSHPRFNVSGGGQMVGVAYLTPYQGSESRRVFGHFKCTKCIKYWMESGVNKSDYREWQNAYSYKDCFQACYQCDVQVYPYHQRQLKKSELHFDDRAKHDVGRCSRCESLRRPCYEA